MGGRRARVWGRMSGACRVNVEYRSLFHHLSDASSESTLVVISMLLASPLLLGSRPEIVVEGRDLDEDGHSQLEEVRGRPDQLGTCNIAFLAESGAG